MSHIIRCLVLILLSSVILTFIGLFIEKFKDFECTNFNKEYAFKSVIQYWAQFADEHKINYSISDGTLLGWLREKGEFIGFDGDMDAMIDESGVQKLIKLAEDSNERRVIFTKDLKSELEKAEWKPNEIKILVKYNDYYVDCNGDRVDTYKGTCSLGIPRFGGGELYGRVIINDYKNRKYHLDLFSKKKYINYFDKGTKECMLEGIKTKRFSDTDNYIKNRYGVNWNIPWKKCDKQTGQWYKNKQSPKFTNDSELR